MDEAFDEFIGSIETSRQQINLGLHLALRAGSRSELDNVVVAISRQVRAQLDVIDRAKESMKRRDVLRGIGVIGLPALLPSSGIHDALTNPWRTDTGVQPLPALRASVAHLWAMRQAARYDQFTAMVPETLDMLLQRNERHDDAHDLLSMAYQSISGAMAKVGNRELAWIAAERGITSAKQSNDTTVLAAAERMYTHALLAQDRSAQAQAVALDAVTVLDLSDAVALSVYGSLMLTTAVAAARQGLDQAHDYIDEAQRVAEHLGRDHNEMFLAFGLTNVGIHRVSVSVELCEGGRAIEHAGKVDTRGLPNERRAHLFIELAHAHDDHESAVAALLAAERLAPEEVRYNPAARALVTAMLRKQAGPSALALAERMDVGAA